MIDEEKLMWLAWLIVENIKKDFDTKYLSKNLIRTIKIVQVGNQIKIHIPAKTYNMLLFQEKGVVVHTGHGSYANKLNEEGSKFYSYSKGTRKGGKLIKPGNHKNYIDKAIKNALETWKNLLDKKYTMTVM